MKNIIVGTGKFAHEVAKIMTEFGMNLDGFVNNYDPNKTLPKFVYGNYPVQYVENFNFEDSKNYNFIIAKKPMFIGQSIEYLRKKDCKNVFVVNEELFFHNLQSLNDLFKYFDKIDLSIPFLNYLEVNVVDNCNLNCKGCAHFSNISDKNIMSLEQLNHDLKLLCDKMNIYNFRLLGGEPLLHPQIKEIIELSRYYLPNSRIILVTNGLLINKLSPEVLKTMSKCNIIVSISFYKQTSSILDDIIAILKENNINYLINDDFFKEPQVIEKFHTRLSIDKKRSNDMANKMCSGRFCRFLRNGKISKCYYPLLVDILNDKCGANFNVSKDDYIDIDDIVDGWETIEKMNESIPFCDYCRENVLEFDWISGHTKNAELGDYVLKKVKN